LLNFADAAADHPEFARKLPRFVSEVRRLFTADEIAVHLARLERAQIETATVLESPAAAAERVRQFTLIKELLTARAFGTS
jgi:hypothetical protein